MKFDAVSGTVSFDDMLWNVVIKTCRQSQSQFNKEEFLKSPAYSHDFPPCQFSE